jgi:hypothetical protein
MDTRPTDGTCSQWTGAAYCRAPGVRRYQTGVRCADHDVRAMAGMAPLPDSPGVPAYRGEEG